LGQTARHKAAVGNGTDTSSQIASLLTTLVQQTQAASTMASPQGRVQIFGFTKKGQCLAPVTTNALALPQPSHPATQQAAQQTEAASTVSKPGEQLALPAPPLPAQKQDKNRRLRMTLLKSLEKVWRTMKQKPWQLCRKRKRQTIATCVMEGFA